MRFVCSVPKFISSILSMYSTFFFFHSSTIPRFTTSLTGLVDSQRNVAGRVEGEADAESLGTNYVRVAILLEGLMLSSVQRLHNGPAVLHPPESVVKQHVLYWHLSMRRKSYRTLLRGVHHVESVLEQDVYLSRICGRGSNLNVLAVVHDDVVLFVEGHAFRLHYTKMMYEKGYDSISERR